MIPKRTFFRPKTVFNQFLVNNRSNVPKFLKLSPATSFQRTTGHKDCSFKSDCRTRTCRTSIIYLCCPVRPSVCPVAVRHTITHLLFTIISISMGGKAGK